MYNNGEVTVFGGLISHSKISFGNLLKFTTPFGRGELKQTVITPTHPYYKAPFMEQWIYTASVCQRCEILC